MQLNRSELIKAIKFLKPAISKADELEQQVSDKIKALTHVHVKIDGDVCQLTAADGHCGKRVLLNRPTQLELEGDGPEIEDGEFLIPRATLEAYETLLIKHKSRFEKSARIDHSLKLIDIFSDSLESHKDKIEYLQPVGVHFPEIDQLFFANAEPVQNIKINYMTAIDALKEFNDHVEVTFSGENGAIYIATEDKTYQAFFLPVQRGGEGENR